MKTNEELEKEIEKLKNEIAEIKLKQAAPTSAPIYYYQPIPYVPANPYQYPPYPYYAPITC